MEEKIIKNCCKFCVELGVNCLGCAIAAGVADNAKFETYCDDCIAKGECIKKFQNLNKNRETCWILSDEDREIYRKENPEFAKQEEEKEKKIEEEAADKMTDADVEKLERMLELRKRKKAEKEGNK